MTQESYFWDQLTTGDAALAPYGHAEVAAFFASLINAKTDISGIVPDDGDELMVQDISSGSSYKIRVPSGKAFVKGYYFENDANVDSSVSPESGYENTYYSIVLRAEFSTQKVRISKSGPSTATYPSVYQGTSFWEIKLADVLVHSEGGGIYSVNVYDRRISIHRNNKISILVAPDEGYEYTSLNEYFMASSDGTYYGIKMVQSKDTTIKSSFVIPLNFMNRFNISPIIYYSGVGAGVIEYAIEYVFISLSGGVGDSYVDASFTFDPSGSGKHERVASIPEFVYPYPDYVVEGNLVTMSFTRVGDTNPQDTLNDPVYFVGFLVEFYAKN